LIVHVLGFTYIYEVDIEYCVFTSFDFKNIFRLASEIDLESWCDYFSSELLHLVYSSTSGIDLESWSSFDSEDLFGGVVGLGLPISHVMGWDPQWGWDKFDPSALRAILSYFGSLLCRGLALNSNRVEG